VTAEPQAQAAPAAPAPVVAEPVPVVAEAPKLAQPQPVAPTAPVVEPAPNVAQTPQPQVKPATPQSAPATPPTADSRPPTQPVKPEPAKQPEPVATKAEPPAQPQVKPATAEPAATPPTADSRPPTQAPAAQPTSISRLAPQPAAPPTPVRLPHAPEAVENTIRIGQARGVTHARLQLHPADLGGVEIHLTHTSDGLVARVTTDVHQAAQVLQQAGDDLRRQLQAQGIDLQRLDIGVAGEPGHDAGAAQERHAGGEGRPSETAHAEEGPSAEARANDPIELPDGVLVDVLA
jgi:flagellar hook-length control protein FliK